MNKNPIYALGLMSGTSLDGLDLCYVKFLGTESYEFEILETETVKYSEDWSRRLKTVISANQDELDLIDIDYGKLLAYEVNNFLLTQGIEQLDFIASHGHTVFHQPQRGITKQIGDGQVIADMTGYKVVCDFRTQDVELGGQGAPLVPIGDALLFNKYKSCLNLGGFANVSFEQDGRRVAYDICPVNIVCNELSNRVGLPYDDQGKLAAKGKVNAELLTELNQQEYYALIPPKSLGAEWVNQIIWPLIENYELSAHDALATFCEHVAFQISNSLQDVEDVLITGGGAYNTFLLECIDKYYPGKIFIQDTDIIEYKEALIFALLGLLKIQGKNNCLKSVTGASRDHCSGRIFNPNFK